MLDRSNRTAFLNQMDGFANSEGLFIIASSNHPGEVDEALLKRPSRFDRVLHIGLPSPSERTEYSRRLLQRMNNVAGQESAVNLEQLAVEISTRSDGFTLAYLKEAFTGAALHSAQAGHMRLDEHFAEILLAQVEELRVHFKQVKNPDALAEMNSGDNSVGLLRR